MAAASDSTRRAIEHRLSFIEGQLHSNAQAPAMPSGATSLRTFAASRALSDGNKETVKPAPPAPSNQAKQGAVKAPAKEPPDRNKAKPEPPLRSIDKEALSCDPFVRAGERARKALKR